MPTNNSVLALDVGSRRVGIAIASLDARLPRPLTTLLQGDSFINELKEIINNEGVNKLVIGLPRGLEGQNTAQTAEIENFAERLKTEISLPVDFQDEAVTSAKAETELRSRGKPYKKSDIDALAATYILEDWLAQHKGEA